VRVFASPAQLAEAVGTEIGASDWLVIEQDRIDGFAEATGDHQWIHVDEARAKDGPFGSTIAHGFLTLSLLPMLTAQIYRVDGVRMGINYGLNRVRFVSPVRVGSSVRAAMTLTALDELPDAGAVQITGKVVVEIQGAEKPAAVAETLTRFYV
jgi:acyl dehydratase